MPGSNTRNRILDAAERLFAEGGFRATSLNSIVAEASVNSAAIHYHFGGRDELFAAVVQRRMGEVEEERIRLLDRLETRFRDGAPPVEEILRAFLMPTVRLARRGAQGKAWVRFIGLTRLEPGDHWAPVREPHAHVLERFVTALRKSLPHLPAREVRLRFFFALGAIANTLLDVETPEMLGGNLPSIDTQPEALLRSLIPFLTGGLSIPLKRPASRTNKARAGR